MKKIVIILLVLIFIAGFISAQEGACVFEKDFEKYCKAITSEECSKLDTAKFYEGYLCSAKELNTICARQTSTTCSDGKVYWMDSCGNKENVFSSDKENSWNNGLILDLENSCPINNGSDKDCGNCDGQYVTCKPYIYDIEKPSSGDYLCKNFDTPDSRPEKNNYLGEKFNLNDIKVESLFSWKNILSKLVRMATEPIIIGLIVFIIVIIYFIKKFRNRQK